MFSGPEVDVAVGYLHVEQNQAQVFEHDDEDEFAVPVAGADAAGPC